MQDHPGLGKRFFAESGAGGTSPEAVRKEKGVAKREAGVG